MLVTYGDGSMDDEQVFQLGEWEFIRPPLILSRVETKCLRASAPIFLPHDHLNSAVHILDRWCTDLVTNKGQRDYTMPMKNTQ